MRTEPQNTATIQISNPQVLTPSWLRVQFWLPDLGWSCDFKHVQSSINIRKQFISFSICDPGGGFLLRWRAVTSPVSAHRPAALGTRRSWGRRRPPEFACSRSYSPSPRWGSSAGMRNRESLARGSNSEGHLDICLWHFIHICHTSSYFPFASQQ